jgi:hypothetical protein
LGFWVGSIALMGLIFNHNGLHEVGRQAAP